MAEKRKKNIKKIAAAPVTGGEHTWDMSGARAHKVKVDPTSLVTTTTPLSISPPTRESVCRLWVWGDETHETDLDSVQLQGVGNITPTLGLEMWNADRI